MGRLSDFSIQLRTFCSTGSLSCSSTSVFTSRSAIFAKSLNFCISSFVFTSGFNSESMFAFRNIFGAGSFGLIRLQVRSRAGIQSPSGRSLIQLFLFCCRSRHLVYFNLGVGSSSRLYFAK